MEQYKYKDLTGKIIKAAMNVHNTLGLGFQEVIYQRALKIEFTEMGIGFQREYEAPIHYKGTQIGTRRVDFFVEEKVLVELKAISELKPENYMQIINYLTVFKMEVGLLINFGEKRLKFKRFVNTI